jgi:NAD(P)-dependent dehydrogenase (short-subunit alcohol dehydrogenase family)
MQSNELLFRPGLMKGQRILVTGGGSGLGRVMAEAALMLGAELVIVGRRGGVLEDSAHDMMEVHGGSVLPLVCDIRDAGAIETMLDRVWEDGPLTGLVNNAAGNFISRTEDLSPRGFDAIANIVFRGSFLTTLGCGKRWIAGAQRASVLSIVTTWAWNGSAYVVPSAMSKAGVVVMTQSLAVEWGGKGIRFNAIAPGLFPTEGMMVRLKGGQEIGSDDMRHNPLRRVGRMSELANLAMFLLHPGSEYVNGQVIAIDGGEFQATGGNFSAMREWSDEQWREARESSRLADVKDRTARDDVSSSGERRA